MITVAVVTGALRRLPIGRSQAVSAGSQLLKRFLAFDGKQTFVTVFTKARHLSLS